MSWKLGTIGFAYPDWAGGFYPPDLPTERRLSYYATQFPAIELDTTYYGLPSESTVDRWRAQVPEEFIFSLKSPAQITHEADRLVGELALWREFEKLAARLGEDRTVLLLQFGPSFAAPRLPDLKSLLQSTVTKAKLAVELRHPSWWDPATIPAVAGLLRDHAACWVQNDLAPLDEAGRVPLGTRYTPRPAPATTDWTYLRLCGIHDQCGDSRELVDATPRLQWWLDQLGEVRSGLGFCGNSYAGYGPGTAAKLGRLLDIPEPTPWQPGLFDG